MQPAARDPGGPAPLAGGPRAGGLWLLRALVAAAALIPLVVLSAGGWLAWRDQLEQAHAALERTLDAASENATKILETNQLLLRQMETLLDGRGDAALLADEATLHRQLADMLEDLPQLQNLLVYSAAGTLIATANQYPVDHTISRADRDYFHDAQVEQGSVVSRANIGRLDGKPFFSIVRRRQAPDGSFAGLVSVSINPAYFVDYFRRLAADPVYGDGLILVLRRNDYVTLVAYPPSSDPDPLQFRPISPALRDEVARSPDSGTLMMPDDDHRPERLMIWRRLSVLPVTLYAGVTRATIRHRWAGVMVTHLYFGVPASLALIALSVLALRRSQAALAASGQAMREAHRREQAELAAREAQKMEALGKLTSGIAHDFNNLLAIIMGNAELALNRPPERARRLLEGVIAAAQRGERLTRQFLAFARHRPAAVCLLDLRETVPFVLEMLQPILRGDVQVQTRVADDVWPVMVDPGELEIALLNLAINARDAMPQGGALQVRAYNVAAEPGAADAPRFDSLGLAGDHVALSVADNGKGMPPDVQARAFEPFFTTKEVGVGTGLGLSQVYSFARQSGGTAVIESAAGRGTSVTLLLPRAAGAVTPEVAAEAPAPPPAGFATPARRVLLVEDNEEVATVTAALLRAENCVVDIVDRVAKAHALLDGGEVYQLILSDIVMPGASGIDFAHAVSLRWPECRLVLITGFIDQAADVPAGVPVLGKPLRMAEFRRLLGSTETGSGLSHSRT